MIANIIATIGLFIGIMYTIAVVIRIPHIDKPGVKIYSSTIVMAAIGWTTFISAMWIFK